MPKDRPNDAKKRIKVRMTKKGGKKKLMPTDNKLEMKDILRGAWMQPEMQRRRICLEFLTLFFMCISTQVQPSLFYGR